MYANQSLFLCCAGAGLWDSLGLPLLLVAVVLMSSLHCRREAEYCAQRGISDTTDPIRSQPLDYAR